MLDTWSAIKYFEISFTEITDTAHLMIWQQYDTHTHTHTHTASPISMYMLR